MVDYSSIADRVRTKLQGAGAAMTLRKVTEGDYDPATGTYSGGSSNDYTVYGLIVTQSFRTAEAGQRYSLDTVVQTDDRFVLLSTSADEVVPVPGDLLIIGGVTYTVIVVINVEPDGTDLLHKVIVRK